MFYIRWGKAAVYSGYGTSNEKLLANLNTGDYFGEMSLLEHEDRSATVVSLESDTTLSRISEEDFSEVIFKEGAYASTMYEVVSGCVGIYKNFDSDGRKKLASLRQSETFGEMELSECYPRSATAVALEDETVVYEFSGEEFASLL